MPLLNHQWYQKREQLSLHPYTTHGNQNRELLYIPFWASKINKIKMAKSDIGHWVSFPLQKQSNQ